VPDFNFTTTQCDNGKVDFTNTTPDPAFGSVNYLWKFGDGAQSTLNAISHTYNNFNVYNVVLVGNTSLGCADSVIKQVTLRQSPTAGFTNTSAQCTNEAITFTNSSVVPASASNHYEWDFGDGNTSVDQDPIHQYASPGVYNVKLKSFSTNGCESNIDAILTINLKPKADFEATDVCKGKPIDFRNGSYTSDNTALTYLWDFDNGNTSTQDNPTITYANAGTYSVSLTTNHSNGCNDVITKQVKVFELPVVVINSASRQTGDRAMLFTTNTTGTGYTYLWLFGDGGKSYDQNPTYLYSGDGKMTVTLVITTPEGCSNSTTTSVIINSLGVSNINGIGNLVNVYPNPSTGKFVVDFTKANADDVLAINVTDMLGRQISNPITINNAGLAQIDLTNQAAGIYYLNISTSTGTHTVKLNVSR
jgi:PKD repeat protein